jgi:predicted secreted protein
MARSRIYNYVFTPGTAGLGTIQVPNNVPIEDFLAIYNTTDNLPIFNFADNTLGGTAVWTPGTDANFATNIKMGQSSNLYAVAKAGDKFLFAVKEVKVTLGGCGG